MKDRGVIIMPRNSSSKRWDKLKREIRKTMSYKITAIIMNIQIKAFHFYCYLKRKIRGLG